MVVDCKQCGKKYQIPEHLAGKRLKCKACGNVMVAPGASSEKARTPASAAAPSAARASAAKKPIVKPAAPVQRVEEDDPFAAALAQAEQEEAQGSYAAPAAAAEEDDAYGTPIALAPPSLPATPRSNSSSSGGVPQEGQPAAPDTQSLAYFRTRFSDKRQALVAYGNARAMRYARNRTTPECCSCGRPSDTIYEVKWKTSYGGGVGIHWATALTIFYGRIIFKTQAGEVIEFRTFHRLCSQCVTHSRVLRIVGTLGYAISLFLAIPAAALTLFGVVISAGNSQRHSTSSDGGVLLVIGFVLLAISVPGVLLFPKLGVPGALRAAVGRPFTRGKMTRV